MQRSKRFTLRRVALGLAVAAILVPAAQAKPTASTQRQQPTIEIPYLSGGVGVSHMDFDPWSGPTGRQSDEIPYLSHGVGLSGRAIAADDLTVSRPSNQGSPAVGSSDDGLEVGSTAIGGFGVALVLLIGGSVLAVRHNRKTRLSPA